MTPPSIYRQPGASVTTGANGAIASVQLVKHTRVVEQRLYQVGQKIWSAVGHGMANSIMIEAPEGLIIIDTGEGIEEAGEQLALFRTVSSAPVRAVIYSHSHYVHGTQVWQDEAQGDLQVWGHARIRTNLADTGAEIGPAYIRRLMAQFSFHLPEQGPDAMPNQGTGITFFHRSRPTTARHVPVTHEVNDDITVQIAGTTVRLVPAPSDSDDTLIIHFPELDCVVNNHVWPVLFNVYTLRGEKYRDPRQFVKAIDLIRQMDPQHLVGVHGPPITPRENARQALLDYRDSIQYLWDQTVRGMNNGLTTEQIVEQVTLPDHLEHSPYIPQVYGEVPFHVRAICNGELGWFDMDASRLHPVPPREEAQKMITGFGGWAAMVAAVEVALAKQDWSWAAQLAAYLHRSEPDNANARRLKALALRGIARVTPAANTRSICLTEALTLEGEIDPMARTPWRMNRFRLLGAPPARFVEALRVRLDPHRSAGVRQTLAFSFTEPAAHCALQIDRGLARFLDGEMANADLRLQLSLAAWADLYTGKRTLAEVSAAGEAMATPSVEAVVHWFKYFDHIRLG